jgi:hypothetical protein
MSGFEAEARGVIPSSTATTGRSTRDRAFSAQLVVPAPCRLETSPFVDDRLHSSPSRSGSNPGAEHKAAAHWLQLAKTGRRRRHKPEESVLHLVTNTLPVRLDPSVPRTRRTRCAPRGQGVTAGAPPAARLPQTTPPSQPVHTVRGRCWRLASSPPTSSLAASAAGAAASGDSRNALPPACGPRTRQTAARGPGAL